MKTKRHLFLLTIITCSLLLVACEDDPMLDEVEEEGAAGSYGKSTFIDVPYYEDLIEK
jgi:hypothetical protein